MSQTNFAAARTATTRPALVYDGRISELFGIFLLNLLLTIITFGIFRFWAITRLRRYLWSHMRFEGTRLAYTGLGKELFYGFLLAMMILGLVFAGIGVLAAYLATINPGLAAIPIAVGYIGVFILFGAAHFTAQRYRLSRTEWRGIRGGMTGSALRYGVAWLLYAISIPLTLYQSTPWMQVGLARRRINATRFGSAVFHFEGRAGRIYLSWLAATVGNLLLLGLMVAVVTAVSWSSIAPLIQGNVDGPEVEIALRRALPVFVIAILVFSVLSGLLMTWYAARLVRLIMSGTSAAIPGVTGVPGAAAETTLQFGSSVTGGRLLWLFLSNALIALLTLGFGLPIVLHRSARYLAETTWISGDPNLEALVQSSTTRPAVGEGFLQALDPGIV